MNKISKVISTALILTLLLGLFTIRGFADTSSSETPLTATGYLTGSDNVTHTIEGIKISSVEVPSRSDCVTVTETYGFLIPRSIMEDSHSNWDPTGSVYATVTVKYDKTSTQILVTQAKGNWTIYDSQVSVTSASLYCVCRDAGTWQDITFNNISKNLYYNTGFSTYVLKTGSAGATMTANLKRGSSSTWSFTCQVAVAPTYN